ncbi:MAG: hypothetical protein ACYSR9_12475 [Planctomycetota bacterium]
MNHSKIISVAAITTIVGTFAYFFTMQCLKLAEPHKHNQDRVPAKPPKIADKAQAQDEATKKEVSAVPERDIFADCVKYNRPTILIQSSIDSGPWIKDTSIYPLKGRKIVLKVDRVPEVKIRWYQIVPDISKIYKNANFPWEKDPYKWIGLAKIDYHRKELTKFRDIWQINPFDDENDSEIRGKESSSYHSSQDKAANSRFYHKDVGSFWFQAEIAQEGKIYRSPGIEDSDERGLSPKVFRVSIRDGNGYIGYLTSFFNVPGLFGSITYQSSNYIGTDCADVLMAAYGKWKNKPITKNYNVAMLVSQWRHVEEFDILQGTPDKQLKWGRNINPGDFIAVRYSGSKQYQHIGALFEDANKDGLLDGGDIAIHAGPVPLHCSYIREGNFDGHVVILRP